MNNEAERGKLHIDFHSIKTTTLVYFMLFAVFMVLIIWVLQDLFINKYYENMRVQEATRTATALEGQFQDNPRHFAEYANDTAHNVGILIRVDTANSTDVYDGINGINSQEAFSNDLEKAKKTLTSGKESSIGYKISAGDNEASYLLYATNVMNVFGYAKLYIVTPLFPSEATISVIKNMLEYISFIILGFGLILAIYLSIRLTKPIENITKSAHELSKGNYNVKFSGGNFTETTELAKVLNTASYEMEQSDFYQREIIANVSHDLKTPLTMIKSYAEMIQDISGDNPEKRNEHLNVIISETDRLNMLVMDMMESSKLQSNAIKLDKEYFDIVEVAREAYESFRILNTQEGYKINFRPCKPAFVYGDKARLSQVIHNFISNAVKYSGEDKYISIELKRSAKKVSIHVIDHGIGIPKDAIPHVWDRYFRSSANHERKIEGTGLGLSICKGVLSLHNADYGVKSEEGKGSDFWFELPVVKPPKQDKVVEVNNGKED